MKHTIFPRYCPALRDSTDISQHGPYKLLHMAAVNVVLCPRGSNRSKHELFFSCSQRFEPSSRTSLIGEQPNPWELLHPQDEMSRHRGAELRRRYGRSGGTSLLSPE